MKQIFFVAPTYMHVRTALSPPLPGVRTHGWSDTDNNDKEVIGVVELSDNADSEVVIDRLEAQGIVWLPNHHHNQPLEQTHVKALEKHGVKSGHTTKDAMDLLHKKSGFFPLKAKRF